MNKETIHKLMRLGWILPLICGVSLSVFWAFKMGVKNGREELITQLNQPELRMMHFRGDNVQLILIEQRMALGNLEKQRVEINVSGIDGLEAERLGSSSSGTHGYLDEVSVWRIRNSTDVDLQLSEAEFTNLPNGFKIPKEFDNAFSIPPNPKS